MTVLGARDLASPALRVHGALSSSKPGSEYVRADVFRARSEEEGGAARTAEASEEDQDGITSHVQGAPCTHLGAPRLHVICGVQYSQVGALEACQSSTARDLLVGMRKLSSLAPHCSGIRAPLSAAPG